MSDDAWGRGRGVGMALDIFGQVSLRKKVEKQTQGKVPAAGTCHSPDLPQGGSTSQAQELIELCSLSLSEIFKMTPTPGKKGFFVNLGRRLSPPCTTQLWVNPGGARGERKLMLWLLPLAVWYRLCSKGSGVGGRGLRAPLHSIHPVLSALEVPSPPW